MALTPLAKQTADDGTTLVYNAISLLPGDDFDAAKQEVIAQLTLLDQSTTKPTAMSTVVAFVNTLDDIAYDVNNTSFEKIMDAVKTVTGDVAQGKNIIVDFIDALKLKKAANAASTTLPPTTPEP